MGKKAIHIFTHIPKTAGTSIYAIIARQYFFKPGKTFTAWTYKNMDTYARLPENEKKQIKLIKGHLYFGTHEYAPYPVLYFTMLRDPIKRSVSLYDYCRSNKWHKLYAEIHLKQYTLKQFLESRLDINMDNGQVRYLCGIENIPYGEVNDAHLQKAIDNLKKSYSVIGLTEYFDESILLFAKKLHWSNPYYIKENVSSARTDITQSDAATLALLKHYNRYDEALYNAASAIFQKQVQEAGPTFKNEVNAFAQKNKQRAAQTKIINFFIDKFKYFQKYYFRNILENI